MSNCKLSTLEAENANLRRAILNYWGTCNPPMNEAQQRCEDALLDALSEYEKEGGYMTDNCKVCGHSKSQHHHSGDAYGECGQFVPLDIDDAEAAEAEKHVTLSPQNAEVSDA